jgi:hypothetical protein
MKNITNFDAILEILECERETEMNNVENHCPRRQVSLCSAVLEVSVSTSTT